MSHVDLGFSQECESWQVESYQFPSKIGGKPAWLSLENLPNSEQLQCGNCHNPMIFLCQIYAPFEEDDSNFHRTIFVFICRDPKCCVRNSISNVKAFRNSLPRLNKFYSYEPPESKKIDFSLEKWVQLCNLCGCLADKHCSKCKEVYYCSRDHQVIDWKENHKHECAKDKKNRLSSKLFHQFEVVIEAEDVSDESVDEEAELNKFHQLELEGRTGSMNEISEDDLEKYAACDDDKTFMGFKKRISANPEQILRYERGGQPLWIANEPKPDIIPNCEYCGSPRQYEFQIMPQLLTILQEYDLDLGIIVIYTCSKSCVQGDNYKKEFVFRQDVATNT